MDDITLPPAYAADTVQVLREVLGRSEADIQSLLEAGAVEHL
jgi:hypothetical protein